MRIVLCCMLMTLISAKKSGCLEEAYVETRVSEFAPGSSSWLEVVGNVSDVFPQVTFTTVWVNPEDMENNELLPASYGTFGGKRVAFTYDMSFPYLRRWIQDGLCGHFSLFETTSALDHYMSRHFPVFVHILSEEKPVIYYTKRLPDVGFFWSKLKSPQRNTYIMRDVNGVIHQHANFSHYNLLHVLLPPIIPQGVLDDETPNAIYQEFARQEVIIVSDEPLKKWWRQIADEHKRTGFLLYRCNETSLPCPSVTHYMSNHIYYQRLDTGEGSIDWMRSLRSHSLLPSWRLSTEPTDLHPHVSDVSAAGFRAWLNESTHSFLYLYGDSDEDVLWEALGGQYSHMGRMKITENAHELLPINAAAGQCFVFQKMRPVKMKRCHEFISTAKENHEEL